MIDSILEYNRKFVAEKGYERYATDKYPDKKLAVLSYMDTRLTGHHSLQEEKNTAA